MTLLLRTIDAITDVSLTTTYFQSMDTVMEDYLKHGLCLDNPNLHNVTNACSNVTYVTNLCKNDENWDRKLICSFPLMKWWISGAMSAIILAFTYLIEVITTMTSEKFDHYLEMYSWVCCKEHNKGTVFFYGLILPLCQQLTSLIYGHCVRNFVGYWKSKNKEMITTSSTMKKTCFKHCEKNGWEDKVCMICSHNVQDSEKVGQLKAVGEGVVRHSQKLIASTENLLMPMVQFAFLFPTMTNVIFSSRIQDFSDFDSFNPKNWTSILIILSIVTSLISLGASQTQIYFTSPGKSNQKTIANTSFIFLIIMLQVLPKLLACQAFSFGLMWSKWHYPDGILVVLLVFPYLSSICKTLIIARLLGAFHNVTFEKINQLLLSPFIFTRIEKDEVVGELQLARTAMT